MKRVFHFSGGGSSGLMVLQNYQPGDVVIFCDTGREDPDTYRFVRDFEKENNIPIVWLTGDWRKEVIVKEQMIPNRFKRKCTLNLKIRKARRYLRSLGWFTYTQFIGFRKDEQTRIKDYSSWKAVTTRFPLDEIGVTEEMVGNFWNPIPYRLNIPPILKNCDLCFQKGEAAVMAIMKNDPTKADKWIEDEEDKAINPKGYTYFKGVTIRQLRDKALLLTGDYDLYKIGAKFNCSCTS